MSDRIRALIAAATGLAATSLGAALWPLYRVEPVLRLARPGGAIEFLARSLPAGWDENWTAVPEGPDVARVKLLTRDPAAGVATLDVLLGEALSADRERRLSLCQCRAPELDEALDAVARDLRTATSPPDREPARRRRIELLLRGERLERPLEPGPQILERASASPEPAIRRLGVLAGGTACGLLAWMLVGIGRRAPRDGAAHPLG